MVLELNIGWTGFYGQSATPGYQRRPWGDIVVPTGWRRWGRSMNFPSFCRISLKGLKGDSASSCSQGLTLSSSPGIPDEGTLRANEDVGPSRGVNCEISH